MHTLPFRRFVTATAMVLFVLCQETWALAGTTGTLSGSVTELASHAPVSGATVTASSSSEVVSTTTDSGGRFTFASLIPDTYTVSAQKSGLQPVSLPGITVFADQVQTVAVSMERQLKTIATVTSRSAANLVKPGTTADLYSVNAAQQAAAASLGGGVALNSAYSAIASVPGVYIPQGQSIGWSTSVYVRGANYTQLGYEFDGVPVQRAFDQYPASTLSALGQQELQVYTGAAPANAQSNAIGGFINQVIKTGSYPGFGGFQLGIGTPAFYHRAMLEAGGATPNRNFSYYVAAAGYDQAFRYGSQYNGADLDANFGSPYNIIAQNCGQANASVGCYTNTAGFFGMPVGPYGYAKGPFYYGINSLSADREAVANFHFSLPHKRDGGRDDIQLLFDSSFLRTQFPTAFSDWTYAQNDVLNGTATFQGRQYQNCATVAAGTPCALLGGVQQTYDDSSVFTGPIGAPLTSAMLANVGPYYQPGSPTKRAFFAQTPLNERDFYSNNSGTVKLQYQKNLGTNAYLRVYGYQFYSDWLQQALSGATINENFVGAVTPDYSIITHTSGVVGSFVDQITNQHLLDLTLGYTHASTIRWNDQWYIASPTVALAVNSANPTNGICYAIGTTPGSVGTPVPCDSTSVSRYRLPPVTNLAAGLMPSHGPDVNRIATDTCGGAACEYYTVGAGYAGSYNTVTPVFSNLELADTWRPNDRWLFNLGLRYDDFKYELADTTAAPSFLGLGSQAAARTLYQNSFNTWYCFNAQQGLYHAATANGCPAGQAAHWSNAGPSANDYHAWEPRFGGTFTMNPRNVVRFSWGKYEQPASSAFQQYQNVSNNLAVASPNKSFYPLGFQTAAHTVFPEESYNTDVSWEHQAGPDLSFKVTPFLRKTRNEIFNVLLDPRTNFQSGVNVGTKTVYGTELALQKGDFARDGLAAVLSYTYTHGTVKFSTLSNGNTVVDGVNQVIAQYNAFTSFCANNPSDSRCQVKGSAPIDPSTGATIVAAPCYTSSGAADATCAAGDIANPYWKAPVQSLFDPGASYVPYNQLPGTGVSSVSSSYIIPHVAALILNYRHKRFAITPSFQLEAGGKYGSPVQGIGIDPMAGCAPLAGSTSGDPRYPYGAAGGAPYDAQTCTGSLVTPDFQTNKFDNFGAYTEPTQLVANLQMTYEASPRVSFTLVAANLYNRCFGGSKVPWQIGGGSIGCWYTGTAGYDGNFFNPGVFQEVGFGNAYTPTFGNVFQSAYGGQANPANIYITANIKL